MDKIMRREAEVPTDMLAGLLMLQESAPSTVKREPERLSVKIYLVMAVTTLLTFATLTTGYELFFAHQMFA
jgi:predicted membrane channel-forming protein YqfA (hemolysin III family)